MDNSYPINHPVNNPPGSNFNEGTPPGGTYRHAPHEVNNRGHYIPQGNRPLPIQPRGNQPRGNPTLNRYGRPDSANYLRSSGPRFNLPGQYRTFRRPVSPRLSRRLFFISSWSDH